MAPSGRTTSRTSFRDVGDRRSTITLLKTRVVPNDSTPGLSAVRILLHQGRLELTIDHADCEQELSLRWEGGSHGTTMMQADCNAITMVRP